MPHPTRVSGAGPSVTEPAPEAQGDDGPKFVLTPYGWRTVEQAGGLTQEPGGVRNELHVVCPIIGRPGVTLEWRFFKPRKKVLDGRLVKHLHLIVHRTKQRPLRSGVPPWMPMCGTSRRVWNWNTRPLKSLKGCPS